MFVGGGDGTIHHLLQLDLLPDCPVAMVPLGTANVLSYHLRGKQDFSFYSDRSPLFPVPVRLGEVSGRFFLLMAGIGFDGRAAQKVNPRTKRFLGSLAYPLAAFSTFACGPGAPVSLSFQRAGVSLETKKTPWAVLRRFPFYYPPFPAHEEAGMSDHAFRLDLFTGENRRDLFFFFLGAALGKTGRFWRRESFRIEKLSLLEGSPGQMDGESTFFLRTSISVSSRSLTLLFSEKGLRRTGLPKPGQHTSGKSDGSL
uniref:Probable diacylglycerol kinase n=1 Tax=Leptospirillum sp. Group II '5-way CG' TaxID=419541 RepID=B6ANT7_9BACT|nr:MAG: Probable diacylglycerol kinase [Leptospirillum sp. Group II '5-way CG']